MTLGSSATADGITPNSQPDYAYDAPPIFFAKDAAPSGAEVYNVLDDGEGADSVYAGAGNDMITLAADAARDAVRGGGGIDSLDLSAASADIDVIFGSKAFAGVTRGGGLGITSFSSIEKILGSSFSENVRGGAGAETYILKGGNDTISAGGGADTIWGGLGLDRATGGLGNDVFAFAKADFTAGVRDVVIDFHEAAGDKDVLRLQGALGDYNFAAGPAGSVIVTEIASGGSVQLLHFTLGALTDQLAFF